jgi:hypothetical protein
MRAYLTLLEFILHLRNADIVPLPDNEPWHDTMQRICVDERVSEIDEETFDWFLECLPPKYQGAGFAFAEGAEPLKYFWQDHGRFYARQLTNDETAVFCRLAQIPVPH